MALLLCQQIQKRKNSFRIIVFSHLYLFLIVLPFSFELVFILEILVFLVGLLWVSLLMSKDALYSFLGELHAIILNNQS